MLAWLVESGGENHGKVHLVSLSQNIFHHEKSHSSPPPLPTGKVMKTIWSIFSLPPTTVCHILAKEDTDFCRVDELQFYKRKLREVVGERESFPHAFPLSEPNRERATERVESWQRAFPLFFLHFQNLLLFNFHQLLTRERKAFSLKEFSFVFRGARSSHTEFLFVICCFK